MDKKGQGLSMNVIIIAAIALLVLVILAVLILRAGRDVTEGTSCESLGGRCAEECEDLGSDYFRDRSGNCMNEDQICCRTLTGE